MPTKLKRGYLEKNKKPYVIAGPCAGETEDQLMETTIALAKTGKVDMLRAGIWKPRTRPGTFEGVGAEGLQWMVQARQETGLPVTVEVANTNHIENALKHNIDVLWIGAKTSVNPFSMQEIADALKGTDAKVMVKNPINPSLALWLGAIERLENVGVDVLGVIHRGFSDFGNKKYRNNPTWQIPIDLMLKRPDLAVINDPSHICGNRHLLASVAQKAMDLNFDGIMIEVHRDPDNAWSDAMQQITPDVFDKLISDLVIRKVKGVGQKAPQDLEESRRKIDIIDEELISILGKRMDIVREIGKYKKENNTSVFQKSRWEEIVAQRKKMGETLDLSPDFIQLILKAIHVESINIQETILNKK
jgi:3-deoxy-7-phosphoheptulonate synthase